MPSPIDHLVRHLIPSLANIAPEKAGELQGLLTEFGVVFDFDDETPAMVFEADHADHSITLGLRALERLWARAYAYTHLYECITTEQLRNPGAALDLDLTRDPEVRGAMTLLAWALDVEHRLFEAREDGDPGDISWPADLPHPDPAAPRGSMKHAADELFLCAIGAVLHHEMGHFRFDHDPRELPKRDLVLREDEDTAWLEGNARRIQWEKQADAWSAGWLLGGLDPRDDRFLKRVLGLALGHLWSASRNVHTGRWHLPDYPPAWDRFYHTIKQHVPDMPMHPIWTFAAFVLQLHLQAKGVNASPAAVETPEAWVNALLDHVSRTAREPNGPR